MAQLVKNLPKMWETWVQSLGWEDPLEKEMATHSSILAWKIPWTEEPGRLWSMGSQTVGHDWATFTSLRMTISVGTERAFAENSTSILTNSQLLPAGYRENTPQHTRSHIWQTHSKRNTQWWKAKSLPAKIWNKAKMPQSHHCYSIVLEVPQ